MAEGCEREGPRCPSIWRDDAILVYCEEDVGGAGSPCWVQSVRQAPRWRLCRLREQSRPEGQTWDQLCVFESKLRPRGHSPNAFRTGSSARRVPGTQCRRRSRDLQAQTQLSQRVPARCCVTTGWQQSPGGGGARGDGDPAQETRTGSSCLWEKFGVRFMLVNRSLVYVMRVPCSLGGMPCAHAGRRLCLLRRRVSCRASCWPGAALCRGHPRTCRPRRCVFTSL